MNSTGRFIISRFEAYSVPVQAPGMAVVARFSVHYGWLVLNGLGLAVLPDRLRVLMPKSEPAYRLRIRDKAAYEALVEMAADHYESITGIVPETVEINAVVPPATANAYQQDEQLHDHARDSSPPGRDQDRAADVAHRGRERGAGR